jgi:hypothetical protein
MWKFTRIRQLAIEHMSLLTIEPVTRIELARVFHIPHWFLPALDEYSRQKDPITILDVYRLGLDTILKVIPLREQKWSGNEANYRATYDFTEALRTAFQQEIERIKNPVRTTTLPDGSELTVPKQQSDIPLASSPHPSSQIIS